MNFESFGYVVVPTVYIATSTDDDLRDHILLATFDETAANELVTALQDADTSQKYDYRVIKKMVAR